MTKPMSLDDAGLLSIRPKPMKDIWDILIQRAEHLTTEAPESSDLLRFYTALLRSQKDIYGYLRTQNNWLPSGDLARDLSVLRPAFPDLLRAVAANGPQMLADQANSLIQTNESDLSEMLLGHWREPSDMNFFAKAFLQPYATWLRESGAKPVDRNLAGAENLCPFCRGRAQVSVLQIQEPSSESGGRSLMCATCLLTWPFRRVVCANCLEENPARIGYYHAAEYDYVRVEACDTCEHYIKAIDLTKYGLAVPLIDEVASAPLDLWARTRGYTKIEMNLVGL